MTRPGRSRFDHARPRGIGLAACALIAAIALTASRAHAESPAERTAKSKVLEGASRLDRGDAAGALELFRQAHATFPKSTYLYNIAIAAQASGEDVEALEMFERFLDEGRSQGGPERVADAERQRAALLPKVATLDVTGAPGGVLAIDGRDRGKLPLPRPVRLSPGTHEVTVTRPGYARFQQSVNAEAGGTVRVDAAPRSLLATEPVAAEPPSATLPTAAAAITATPAQESSARPLYRSPWVWGVAAAVVVGTVAVLLLTSTGGGRACPSNVDECP